MGKKNFTLREYLFRLYFINCVWSCGMKEEILTGRLKIAKEYLLDKNGEKELRNDMMVKYSHTQLMKHYGGKRET